MGIDFEVVDPGDAENSESSDPIIRVRENALRKAEAVSTRYPDRIVVAADTIVVLDGRIIEKPKSVEEAKDMLRALGGRTHTVVSAVAVVVKDKGSHRSQDRGDEGEDAPTERRGDRRLCRDG